MRRHDRSIALAALLVAAPLAAQPRVTIDFAEFRSPTTRSYQATPGGEVYSKGFALFNSSSSSLFTWGTDPSQNEAAVNVPRNLGPIAAAMAMENLVDRTDMYVWNGPPEEDVADPTQLFNLYSMRVGHTFSTAYLPTGVDLLPISLFFYGFTRAPNGSQVNTLVQSFTIPAPPVVGGVRTPALTDLVFSSAWRSLSSVTWFNASGPANAQSAGLQLAHQFTAIEVAVIPEPATLVLLGGGLAVLAVFARRRV